MGTHTTACATQEFTAEELVLFPSFILALHGDQWNELGWSKFVVAAAVILLDLLSGASYTLGGKERPVPTILQHTDDPRAFLLQGAAWSFAWSGTELILHLVVAQIGAKFDAAFWIGLVLVVGIGHGGFYALTVAVWRARVRNKGCEASPWWSPVQVAVGVSGYFAFGAGFYAGPSLLALDGIVRFTELIRDPDVGASEKGEDRVELSALREL